MQTNLDCIVVGRPNLAENERFTATGGKLNGTVSLRVDRFHHRPW